MYTHSLAGASTQFVVLKLELMVTKFFAHSLSIVGAGCFCQKKNAREWFNRHTNTERQQQRKNINTKNRQLTFSSQATNTHLFLTNKPYMKLYSKFFWRQPVLNFIYELCIMSKLLEMSTHTQFCVDGSMLAWFHFFFYFPPHFHRSPSGVFLSFARSLSLLFVLSVCYL